MKQIVVNHELCTNCKLCELACSFRKEGVFNPVKSRIRINVFAEDFRHIPLTCFQCADAPCANVCPAVALIKEEGRVRFVEENCIGCKMCMLACPFGVISYDAHKGKIFKCDTCDGDPECVRFCPTGALEYKESELASVARQRDFAKKVAETSE